MYSTKLREAVERHTANGWRGLSPESEGKSHIVSGLNPANGMYYEQRVAGDSVTCQQWAIDEGLVGDKFRISKDIYAVS